MCCTVPESTATVELVFEHGKRAELTPIDGFLLYIVPTRYHERGRRLERIIARDAAGELIFDRKVDTRRRAIYPCREHEKVDYGHGVAVCP